MDKKKLLTEILEKVNEIHDENRKEDSYVEMTEEMAEYHKAHFLEKE